MIVDAGSGPGIVSCLLAHTFPQARVVAVDGVAPLLERAREHADRLGVADRFGTLRTDLDDGLGDLEYPADLLWASRSLHHVGDQRTALEGFARALAPGGAVALLEGGLPARYFPRDIGIGRPGLQSRIDAIQEEWFAKMRAELPGAVTETEDWPALMHAVGLRHVATRTFLLDLPAPSRTRPAPSSSPPSPTAARASANTSTPTISPPSTGSSTRTTRRACTTARTRSC